MNPLRARSLPAIEAIIRRQYLRNLSLEQDPGNAARWEIRIEHRTEPMKTEVVLSGGVYTFREKPARRSPDWDREIETETLKP